MESIQQLINEEKSLLNGCRGWLFKETDPDRRQIIQQMISCSIKLIDKMIETNTLLIESAKLRGEREMLCSKLNDSDKMDI
jgi:hypothetical protein